jgi:hypothetical protein
MAIITATARIKGAAPYSQSRHYTDPAKEKRETAKDYEARTWRERMHATVAGDVIIPAMAFKNCLSEAAKFLALQVPGKGKATYTKHFEAGVMVLEPMTLGIRKADVTGEWLFVPADGKRGGSKRVEKCFPVILDWGGEIAFTIVDPAITEDVFRQHLDEAGKYIGIGRFRPRNNGYYGRFTVERLDWTAR